MGLFKPFAFYEQKIVAGGGGLTPYTTNLDMWWDFGNASSYPGSGTSVTDVSGSYNGTIDGSGYSYSSTDFDGSLVWGTNSTEIDFAYPVPSGEWSMLVWFKRTTFDNLNGIVYSGSGSGTSPKIFLYGGANASLIQLRLTAGASNTYTWDWTTSMVNEWHQMTIVRNSSNQLFISLDKNGLENTGRTDGATPTWNAFGATESDKRNGWDGSIASVMMYSEALDDTAIAQNYDYFAQRL